MFSDFLTRTLTRSFSEGGCGMSTRPAFYSGRGATTTDLSSHKLDTLYKAIEKHVSKEAAGHFGQMVADLPCLSATDFLLALESLESHHWTWSKELIGHSNGLYAEDFGSGLGTIGSVLGGDRVDETASIRRNFLDQHKIKLPKADTQNSYDEYGYRTPYRDCWAGD